MSEKRPLIAINCDFDASLRPPSGQPHYRDRITLYKNYQIAVFEAGGLPLLVPPGEPETLGAFVEAADGVLLTGGDDYPPDAYGEKSHPKTVESRPERSESDLALARLVMGSQKPVLGICAGLQLVNIAAGGKLIQHLETDIPHASDFHQDNVHSVSLRKGSKLENVFGSGEIKVNSAHHQAADPEAIGEGLEVTAQAADGTIEALELRKPATRFFVAVQWHPERIEDDKHRRRIFEAFVASCRKDR